MREGHYSCTDAPSSNTVSKSTELPASGQHVTTTGGYPFSEKEGEGLRCPFSGKSGAAPSSNTVSKSTELPASGQHVTTTGGCPFSGKEGEGLRCPFSGKSGAAP